MSTLVILAGGKSSRMGKDKIFLPFREHETFLEHLYHKAAAVFDRVLISAGSKDHAKKIQDLLPEASVIPDHYPDKGPMGGIVSVFEQEGEERFAVIPVDVPFAEMKILKLFYDRCSEHACIFADENGTIEPLVAAYGKTVIVKMQQLLKEDNYRIRAAFPDDVTIWNEKALREVFPDLSSEEIQAAFRNINTIDEYREYIR